MEKLRITEKSEIKTERLCIRPYSEVDREQLARILMNEEVKETFMIPDFPTEEEYLKLADRLIGFSRIEDENHLEYGVYLGDTMVGFINDCGIEGEEIEIGYVIHPDYKGHGYATEAVKAVISDLWEMGFASVTAGFFEENKASRRVMEKCGMHLADETDEEEYRGEVHRCLYCRIDR